MNINFYFIKQTSLARNQTASGIFVFQTHTWFTVVKACTKTKLFENFRIHNFKKFEFNSSENLN